MISIYSVAWMPRLIATNAERYGVIGVTFAILTWLIALSAAIVVTAIVSAEAGAAGAATVEGFEDQSPTDQVTPDDPPGASTPDGEARPDRGSPAYR